MITAMAKMLDVWAACSWGLLACKDCTLPCSLHVMTSTCDKSLRPCVTNLCSPNAFPLQTPWGKQEVYRRTDRLLVGGEEAVWGPWVSVKVTVQEEQMLKDAACS